MKPEPVLGPWIRRFLLEYMMKERSLSIHTQHSYRDSISLLLHFCAEDTHKHPGDLLIDDLTPERVKAFLLHLEQQRHCTVRTRNQRLFAIHALARFVESNSPEHIEWATRLRTIPSKRMIREALAYLEKEEMNALLEAPDANTAIGHRDRVLFLFLYNSGCRADEAAQVRIEDLELNERSHATAFSSVRIMGKGRKVRYCPLWPKTIQGLLSIIEGRSNTQQHVFLNRYNQPLTRFGIYALVKRYVTKAGKSCRSLNNKRVSPHTIRHTTATHLLRAGVDLNTIRVWLGHVSIDTTNIYTEVDFETKARALTVCEIRPSLGGINPNPDIISFLRRL
jgi:integrase/recombinase XerD